MGSIIPISWHVVKVRADSEGAITSTSVTTSLLPACLRVGRGDLQGLCPDGGAPLLSPRPPLPTLLPDSTAVSSFHSGRNQRVLRARGNRSQTKRRLPPHDCLLRILAGERALLQLVFLLILPKEPKREGLWCADGPGLIVLV